MSPQLTKALYQTRTFVADLSPRQRMLLTALVVAVLGGLWIFAHLFEAADYAPLYSGLAPVEAQEIARKLSQRGVAYELSKDGTALSVAAGQVEKVRMELASEGLPRSGRQGFELFDKPNWMGSDFVEKVNYQRALEGELERTIQTMEEVEAVRVHIALPHESLFSEQERGAKASVVLKLRAGKLSDPSVEAIANLLSSAVDNLQPDNVTVIDADSQSPLLNGKGHGGTRQPAMEIEKALSDKLLATLSPVVGAGRVKAAVNVEYELATSDTTLESYDPNSAAVVNSQITQQRSDIPSEGGVPGSASNVPSAGQPSANVSNEPSPAGTQMSENKSFAIGKTVRHTVEPAGTIKRISAAVLVDDAEAAAAENGQNAAGRRKRTPDEMKQIQEIAEAAIGLNAKRGDRLDVQNISFQSLPIPQPAPPTLDELVVTNLRRWSLLLRYLGLLLVAVALYRTLLAPLKKQILAAGGRPPRPLSSSAASSAALGARGPQGVASELSAGGAELDLEPEQAQIGSEAKRSMILQQRLIDKVKKEPAAASRLVRRWIQQGDS